MESINREEAEKLLNETLSSGIPKMVLDILFPPFTPKEGEVIAVWGGDTKSENPLFLVFKKINKSPDYPYQITNNGISCNWSFARPLTDKEKNI